MKKLLLLRDRVIMAFDHISWLPPLLARLTLAGVFIESGWGKLNHIEKVIGFFTSLGLPAPVFQAHLVAATEFIGGVLLLFGLLTRLASAPLLITMIVAIASAKRDDLHEVSDLFAFPEYLYIVLFIWLILGGAGALSLDHLILKRLRKILLTQVSRRGQFRE